MLGDAESRSRYDQFGIANGISSPVEPLPDGQEIEGGSRRPNGPPPAREAERGRRRGGATATATTLPGPLRWAAVADAPPPDAPPATPPRTPTATAPGEGAAAGTCDQWSDEDEDDEVVREEEGREPRGHRRSPRRSRPRRVEERTAAGEPEAEPEEAPAEDEEGPPRQPRRVKLPLKLSELVLGCTKTVQNGPKGRPVVVRVPPGSRSGQVVGVGGLKVRLKRSDAHDSPWRRDGWDLYTTVMCPSAPCCTAGTCCSSTWTAETCGCSCPPLRCCAAACAIGPHWSS